MANMSIEEIIDRVTVICKENKISHLTLIGSFATGTATRTSDVDFVVYDCSDVGELQEAVDNIETLRKIDIFDFSSIHNEFLLEDIEKYGRQIY
jgi:predicted nucleotidyltransferase